ncbi:hypothetical protein WDW86_11170 [Bdellovibrionota bacterium FG-2]
MASLVRGLAGVILGSCFSGNLVAETPLVVRLERQDKSNRIQNALIYAEKELTLVRNTNFWCGPELVTTLGQFKMSYGELERSNFLYLKQMSERLSSAKKKVSPLIPPAVKKELGGATHYYLGHAKLESSSTQADVVRNLIGQTCESKKTRRPERGASAQIVRNGKVSLLEVSEFPENKVSRRPLDQAGCRERGKTKGTSSLKVFWCEISHYGSALLIEP